jgi:hypothetical protein
MNTAAGAKVWAIWTRKEDGQSPYFTLYLEDAVRQEAFLERGLKTKGSSTIDPDKP